MRGAAWLVLFTVIVLTPLAVAVFGRADRWLDFVAGFGAALGWVAFGLFAVEFALVTRVRTVAAAFGSDALLLFHRAMAFAAVALTVFHVGLLAPGLPDPLASSPLERSGALALWGAVLLIVTSVARRRLRLSYELWLALHRVLALAILGTMAWHVLLVVRAGEVPLRYVVSIYVALGVALLTWQRLGRPLLARRRPWEVVENRAEAGSTRTLVLRAVGHDGLRFAPGQFVWIASRRRGILAEEHPITIASSPELDGGRTIELAIKALGDWSGQIVPGLMPGTRVRLDGPFGAFSSDHVAAQRLVLVAGGIGVSPMRSILLAMRDRGDRRPVTLFFAAHDRGRAMFADELIALEQSLALRVVFVFERPAPGEACEEGFVTLDILRRHLPADLRFTHVFVCGPGPMMDAVDRIAVQLGLRSGQVHTERFDMV